MLYTLRTFTCPASCNTSEAKWDLAMMSKQEYIEKYKITEEEYTALVNGDSK